MSCKEREAVLDYLKGREENSELEQHIAKCEVCQALLDGYLEKQKEIEIPEVACEQEQETLAGRVVKFKRGRFRIIIFSLVGLIMGFYSRYYVSETFLPMKVILAVPYKVSRMLFSLVIRVPEIYLQGWYRYELFPQAPFLSALGDLVTPILIGGALYGSIAYFSGDKKVFTLQRFMKFIGVWAFLILLWGGGLYAGNRYQVKRNNDLSDITSVMREVYAVKEGEWTNIGTYPADTESWKEALNRAEVIHTFNGERIDAKEEVIEVSFYFGDLSQGFMIAHIYPGKNWLVTDQNTIYQLPNDFPELLGKRYSSRKETEGDTQPEENVREEEYSDEVDWLY